MCSADWKSCLNQYFVFFVFCFFLPKGIRARECESDNKRAINKRKLAAIALRPSGDEVDQKVRDLMFESTSGCTKKNRDCIVVWEYYGA